MTDARALLSPEVYAADGITLARRLLGCRLVHETPEGAAGGVIVETEAYMGLSDDAAHSYRGRPGGRVNVQYGPGGFAYIYLIYGMHSCMNVVANGKDIPEAVLIRALRPDQGLELMYRRRPKAKDDRQLCSGPGKLCAALAITASPRIGVDYAVRCRDELWRFTITGDPFVSRKPKEETP